MTKLKQLPDLGRSSRLLMISVKLEDVSDETVFGLAIKIALKRNDLKRCIEMIKEQAKDNRPLVASIVGNDLLTEIENL